ncbi:DnaT-like ssDNA-binding protein [Neisseria shayeganii]|uniref:Putative DnaT-like domain-containing protein n=1 Tax=Neisseria shayeganii TaxID=607712 RepID=A0A7D7RW05_9NEIS|nr:DnaT-like ssDNA-binding protein [Neisseria shayeganii]QMT41244.1 hypothetical protein H3L94_04240 [Neisseria shayeganii]
MIKVPQDSYVSVADATAYHTLRQSAEAWAAMDDTAKERALVTASDFLDVNYRLKDGLNAAMRAGRTEVLPEVQKAVCELAMRRDLLAPPKPKQKSLAKGTMSVTYADDSTGRQADYIKSLLQALIPKTAHSAPVQRG